MPVLGGFHIEDIDAVELHPWPRLAETGGYLNLDNSDVDNDCYIAEITGNKSLASPKNMFEQSVFVVKCGGTMVASFAEKFCCAPFGGLLLAFTARQTATLTILAE